MGAPILLTAFEPFGLKGVLTQVAAAVNPKVKEETTGNASKTVCDRALGLVGPGVDYRVLAVDTAGLMTLRGELSKMPAGVVLTGENVVQRVPVAIEGHANDTGVSGLPMPWARSIPSAFALKAARALSDGTAKESETIGTYWCNAVYREALRWAAQHGRPAVFLHISPWGNTADQAQKVAEVIGLMQRTIGSGDGGAGAAKYICAEPAADIVGTWVDDGRGNFKGECVSLVKRMCPSLPATAQWQQGPAVKALSALPKGAAIATFTEAGHYLGHAAIYVSQDEHGLNVWDQYNTPPAKAVGKRSLRFGGNGVNNGDRYHVIK